MTLLKPPIGMSCAPRPSEPSHRPPRGAACHGVAAHGTLTGLSCSLSAAYHSSDPATDSSDVTAAAAAPLARWVPSLTTGTAAPEPLRQRHERFEHHRTHVSDWTRRGRLLFVSVKQKQLSSTLNLAFSQVFFFTFTGFRQTFAVVR